MNLTEHGLYIVKDDYFRDFPSSGWLQNKGESRPHYFAVTDSSGTTWMIPLSSRVEKYRNLINKIEEQRGTGKCVYYHIGVVSGHESAFVISDMFPVTPKYIRRPYTVNQIPYVMRDDKLIRKLRSKALKYIRLLEQGALQDKNHVLQIRKKLSGTK